MEKEQLAKDILLGTAIGDALGVPFEFESRQQRNIDPAIDMVGNRGFHNQPLGTFSDDTSLSLCLAEAILSNTTLDMNDISNRFVNWYQLGYWTASGELFDIGIGTQNAIEKLIQGLEPEHAGSADNMNNGNGSLMRILPLVLYVKDLQVNEQYEWVRKVSSITHRHTISIVACFYYIRFANCLIKGKNKEDTYQSMQRDFPRLIRELSIDIDLSVFPNLFTNDLSKVSINQIKGSGYVVESLEASIWCLLATNTYKDAVLSAVNLGNDTDTTAAIVGGLAGILYGHNCIPSGWLSKLKGKDYIVLLAEELDKKFN